MKTLYRDNKGLHRWLFACGAVLVLFYLFLSFLVFFYFPTFTASFAPCICCFSSLPS